MINRYSAEDDVLPPPQAPQHGHSLGFIGWLAQHITIEHNGGVGSHDHVVRVRESHCLGLGQTQAANHVLRIFPRFDLLAHIGCRGDERHPQEGEELLPPGRGRGED
jgi:hypothetical protein